MRRFSFQPAHVAAALAVLVGGIVGAAPPASGATATNDTFSRASVLERTLEQNVSDAAAGAGAETGEPTHAGKAAAASLWYRWTAPVDAVVRLDSDLTLESSLNRPAHALAVYTGTSVDSLTPVASLFGAQPSVTFKAVPGTTYRIALNVPARFAAEGSTHLWLLATPRNDDLAHATPVTGPSGTATGYNEWASVEAGEPTHSLYTGYYPEVDGTVWFAWTAPTTGFTRVGVECCAGTPPAVAVYSGASLSGLTALSSSYQCRVGAYNACTSFFHTRGTTYHIAVQGHIDLEGLGRTFTLRWAPVGSGCSIQGTAGRDVLTGTSGTDFICGLDGDDVIKGLGGDDVVVGGPGVDTVDYAGAPGSVEADLSVAASFGEGMDTLQEVEGITGSRFSDILRGDRGTSVLHGGAGPDLLTGARGADQLHGDAGNDVLLPGRGADSVDGGAGTDEVSYQGSLAVIVDLSAGRTTGAGADTLLALENVLGSDSADVILGNHLANQLVGGEGNDTVGGRAGNDKVYGWLGTDRLRGGKGTDYCNGGGDRSDTGASCETYVR